MKVEIKSRIGAEVNPEFIAAVISLLNGGSCELPEPFLNGTIRESCAVLVLVDMMLEEGTVLGYATKNGTLETGDIDLLDVSGEDGLTVVKFLL